MNLFTRTFSKIFKSSNQQELDKLKNLISAINNKEKEYNLLTESDFKEKTANFKKNVQNFFSDLLKIEFLKKISKTSNHENFHIFGSFQ